MAILATAVGSALFIAAYLGLGQNRIAGASPVARSFCGVAGIGLASPPEADLYRSRMSDANRFILLASAA